MVKVCVSGGMFFFVQVVGAGQVYVASAGGEGQGDCVEGSVLFACRSAAIPNAADEALERPASPLTSHTGARLWRLPRYGFVASAGGERGFGSIAGAFYLHDARDVFDGE
jgi:hypothetical protein